MNDDLSRALVEAMARGAHSEMQIIAAWLRLRAFDETALSLNELADQIEKNAHHRGHV